MPLIGSFNVRVSTVFGGVGISPQIQEIRNGTDIIISTPGRFKELLDRKAVFLDELEVFIIDEIDHMLQMGFIEDLNGIVSHVNKYCQSLFFSATISVAIAKLAGRILKNPLTIDVKASTTLVALPKCIQSYVLYCDKGRKRKLLLWLIKDQKFEKILIFTNTKSDAERIGKDLEQKDISVAVLHGDKSNKDRQLVMDRFNSGRITVLVATDIVSRGFDIEDLSYVIHYNVAKDTETYLHRSGRTGRIGNKGTVYSFCDQFDRYGQYQIQLGLKNPVEVFSWHPFHSDKVMDLNEKDAQEKALTARLQKNELKKGSSKKVTSTTGERKKIEKNSGKDTSIDKKTSVEKKTNVDKKTVESKKTLVFSRKSFLKRKKMKKKFIKKQKNGTPRKRN